MIIQNNEYFIKNVLLCIFYKIDFYSNGLEIYSEYIII